LCDHQVVEKVTGAQFAEAFYREAVKPLLDREFPGLRYLAGRLGSGSDVIGFDDARSRDHDWGCRLNLLTDDPAPASLGELLERELPQTFRGRPVRFPVTWNPHDVHQVDIQTVQDFAASRLGVIPASDLDWLCLTGHSVLETVGGPVFHDETASFSPLKDLLSWYPEEVWYFVLASGWQKLAQSLHFVGRTADTGQELQSRLLTSRMITELIRLAFLLERSWIPYVKWTEAALRRLPIAGRLRFTDSGTWQEREQGLVDAIEVLAAKQRDLGLPTPDIAVQQFYDRPYRTVTAGLAEQLRAGAGDLQALPLIGSIEQWVDSVDILARPEDRPATLETYRALILRHGASA
jgi:hypothetical protein